MIIPAAATRNSLVSLTLTTKLLTVFLPSVTDTVQVMVSVVTVRRSTAVRMMPSPAQTHAMTQARTEADTCHDTGNDSHRHMP